MSKIGEGPRTIMAFEALGIISLDYQKEKYDLLNTTVDFTKKSSNLASVGLSKDREVILVSKQDEEVIITQWDKFLAEYKLKTKKPLTPEKILSLVNFYSKQVLNASNPQVVDTVNLFVEIIKKSGKTIVLPNETHPRAVIFLSEFLSNRCGVCRHHALVNGIILGHLINKHQVAAGQVRQFRDETMDDTVNDRSGAHAVSTYITPDGKIWVLDSLNYPEPFQLDPESKFLLENQKIAKEFQKLVGKKFYDSMFARLLSPEQKKEVFKEKLAITPVSKPDMKHLFERGNLKNVQLAKELEESKLKIDIARLTLLGKALELEKTSKATLQKLIAEASKAIEKTKNPRGHFADPIMEAPNVIKDEEVPEELRKKILVELRKYVSGKDCKEKMYKELAELNKSSEHIKAILAAGDENKEQTKYIQDALNSLETVEGKPRIGSP